MLGMPSGAALSGAQQDHYPDLLPSFKDLDPAERQSVQFTQFGSQLTDRIGSPAHSVHVLCSVHGITSCSTGAA